MRATVAAAARTLGCSYWPLWRKVKSGKLPSVKLGAYRLVDLSEAAEAMKPHKKQRPVSDSIQSW